MEYVYNIFYHLELDKIKYEEIVNCPWMKARNFIEIKNIIEKICTYKNMNFKKFKKNNFLYWKMLNSNIDNLLNLNNIPSIVDNYINWKNIINEYFSPKNINNLQEKFKLTKIISNSLEAKRMDIKKFTDLEKNIFSFLNNYDIRHVNYSSLTIEQWDYNMKLILCAFTLIDFNNYFMFTFRKHKINNLIIIIIYITCVFCDKIIIIIKIKYQKW